MASVEGAANAVKTLSEMFNCSYEEAWKKYMHPYILENYTFAEVSKYLVREEEQS